MKSMKPTNSIQVKIVYKKSKEIPSANNMQKLLKSYKISLYKSMEP